ncbi:MAG: response regulator [Gracilibacteraceae bacterium]|jgi:two-component SAPR family response regulator|nr:response regulator [Gracilibacteraceae bacterium]
MDIVIISPQEETRRLLTSCCQAHGSEHQISAFASHSGGFVHLINENPGLLILDLDELGDAQAALCSLARYHDNMKLALAASTDAHAIEAMQACSDAYWLKPLAEEAVSKTLAKLLPCKEAQVTVRTFGHFDVFIDGQPIHFKNAKAKELLALLVDKRGTVTMEMAVNVLWDNRHYDEHVKQLYRKAVSYLRGIFKDKSLNILVSNRGSCHVRQGTFACDYYDLLDGQKKAIAAWGGEYLFEYPWAESTLAQIENMVEAYTGRVMK